MLPTYRHGDQLLVRRRAQPPRRGQVVVVDLRQDGAGHKASGTRPGPSLDRVVKRVAAIAGDPVPSGVNAGRPVVPPGQLVLLGDNPTASVDSRHYGFVSNDDIVGAVVRRMR